MPRAPGASDPTGATVPATNRDRPRPTPTARRRARAVFFALLGALAGPFGAGVAYAQASVVVEVRTPDGRTADGEVTLMRQDDGRTFSCTTQNGTCRIAAVPGGLYMAILEPTTGERPPTRQVMIPPSGTATLHVATR